MKIFSYSTFLFEPRIERVGSRTCKIPSKKRNRLNFLPPRDSTSTFQLTPLSPSLSLYLSFSLFVRVTTSSEVERIIIIIVVFFFVVILVVIHRVRLSELDFMSRRWGSEAREAFQWDNRGHPAPRSAPARRTAWATTRVPSRLPLQGNRAHRTEAQWHLVNHIS